MNWIGVVLGSWMPNDGLKPILRVVTRDSFAKACDGILELTDKGEVVYKACFAAGTLVHTDKGLVPIEKVRVGTRVLSQPEEGGEQDYRAVINTMAHLDQQVYAVQVKVDGADTLTTLIATPNHPFWVEGPVVDGSHWMATECLQPGFVLQVADGRKASVHASGLIRSTQYPNIGFAADDRAGVGMVLNLKPGQIGLADDEASFKLGTLDLGEPYLTPVYNFTVDEFHTYYVADTAVWVHNTYKAGQDGAVDTAMERAQIEGECFVGETLVWVKPWMSSFTGTRRETLPIEQIAVGDQVLSRCEITGEMAYKKVTKVFAHGDAKVSVIGCNFGPEYYAKFGPKASTAILTTANHPFWVEGKGWTKVRDLQAGDEFLTHNGVKATFRIANLDAFEEEVYNFEVEDFHTYFVETAGIWVHNKKPNGQTCFVAGTLVHTKEELKAIEEICVGDWVLSYPDDQVPLQRSREQSEYFYRQVTATFSHDDELICEVIVWDLTNNIKETLKVTPNHPIYVKDTGWVPAGELKFGKVLVNNDFANLLVKKKINTGERARVYNIEVDEFHSYYVGELGAWVHNK